MNAYPAGVIVLRLSAVLCVEEATRPNRYGERLIEKASENLAAELEPRQVDGGKVRRFFVARVA